MRNMSDSGREPGPLWGLCCACVPAQLTFGVEQLFSSGSRECQPAATSSAAAGAENRRH